MKFRKTGTALAATAALALAAPTAPAVADDHTPASLVDVLGADGKKFDNKWNDFDIVEAAAFAVLEANPDSKVALLTDGDAALTVFVPTDRAFRKFAGEVLGKKPKTEKKTFAAIAGQFDIATIETVLLYHVVPDATITYKQARGADGVALDTAAGAPITVKVKDSGRVVLRDADTDDRNPHVVRRAKNLNIGNPQIAHGLDRVLRPLDLP